MSLDLVTHTIRLLHWKPFLGSAVVIMIACALAGIGDELDMPGRFLVARASVFALAASLAFLIDDPASSTTAPLPTTLRVRRAHRFMIASLPWALCVWMVLVLVSRGLNTSPDNPFPSIRVATEALALAVIACLVSATIGRRVAQPGARASSLVIIVGIAVAVIPPPAQPWMILFNPQYTGMSLGSWWLLIALASVALVGVSWDARTNK